MKLTSLIGSLSLAFTGAAAADTAPAETPKRIEISVTTSGFNPDHISVPAKTPLTLVFTRKTDQGCTKSVVLALEDGKKVEYKLPLGKPVEVGVTFPRAGTLTYACNMDMVRGTIVVQ